MVTVSTKKNRVYQRKFDHEEAQRLYDGGNGPTVHALAERFGVTWQGMARVVDPEFRERFDARTAEWTMGGECPDCGKPCSRGHRCPECAVEARVSTVTETELWCHRCKHWKPDEGFPRNRHEIRRRGRHALCRPCSTEARREYRERTKVPCENCGKPRLHHRECVAGNRRDSGLCLDCFRDTLRTSDEGRRSMAGLKAHIIFERASDGTWIEHDAVEAFNESLAVETFAALAERQEGVYVAVRADTWIARELKQVTSVKAVPVEKAEPVAA